MACKAFTPWLEKLLQFVEIFMYWLAEVWQYILWADNAKVRFLSRKIIELPSW